jgi:hypothetical protein
MLEHMEDHRKLVDLADFVPLKCMLDLHLKTSVTHETHNPSKMPPNHIQRGTQSKKSKKTS